MDGISLLVLPPFGRRGIFLVGTCGACGPHTPGWGVSPSGASDFFDAEKVTKKAPGTPRSPIFVSIGLYQVWYFSATESGFCHLIYSGSINDTPPAVRVGTSSASLILPQATGFARCAVPPSSSANAPLVCLGAAPPGPFYSHIGLPAIQGGIQRGRAPFVSSWGRGT